MSSDFASGQDNVLRGGPGTLMLMDGPGQPTAVGDEGAALSEGTHNFTGTSQCTSSERELDGTITYDGAGGVSGSVTLGDPISPRRWAPSNSPASTTPRPAASRWCRGCGSTPCTRR